jgi:hypothetical protein
MPFSSSYIYVIGRLFNVDSMSINIVRNSSNDNVARPMDFFRHLLTLFIERSQKSPCHGAFSIMNFQETPLFARCCCTSVERLIFDSSLLADLNVFALSEIIILGSPLRPENLRNSCKNPSADKLGSSST